MKRILLNGLSFALDGVLTNKLRSLLTMMGVIFGVTAVVSMLAIGAGAQQEVLAKISLMGVDNIFIYDRKPIRKQTLNQKGRLNSTGLRLSDKKAIETLLSEYIRSISLIYDEAKDVNYLGQSEQINVVATTPEYFRQLDISLAKGRYINHVDVTSRLNVALVGGGVYRKLRRYGAVLGDSIKVDGKWYKVIGALNSKQTSVKKDDNLDFEDFNFNIYIPFGTQEVLEAKKGLESAISRFIIQVKDREKIGRVGFMIERILERHHYYLRDFKIVIPEELLRQHRETQRIFDIVLGAIAGISLLVGGIGIMNIMLASVLERTKEIGLRRAVGATRSDIRFQFLFEAIWLTFLGGVIGLLLAFMLTQVVSHFYGMPTKITMLNASMAFFISCGIGIIFGYMPAKKASDLEPIEALRYE